MADPGVGGACQTLRTCGWVHRSYALHEWKRTAEARDSSIGTFAPTQSENMLCSKSPST